jgi:cyanophycinase
MNSTRTPLLALAALVAAAVLEASGSPERRLVIVGGGERPPAALARFVAWAGGASSRVLVVPWASAEPKESCESLIAELRAHGPGSLGCGPVAPLDDKGKAGRLDAAARASFLAELASATGVFFTGGDQARIMDVLADAELLAAAAVMSLRMITGEGDFTVLDGDQVVVREGLGLVPGVIVDQHFVKRQRENRLFGLVLKHPEERGVGIEEDTALLVTNGRQAEVVGKGPVLLVDAKGRDQLLVTLLRSGQSVDLRKR